MQDTKRTKFSLDWYVVSAKTVRTLLYGLVGLGLLGGATYWGYLELQKGSAVEVSPGMQTARFIEISGQVKVKKANATDFVVANEKTPLEAGDTVQTLTSSVARVQFVDGSSYTIKPETTLVIKDNELMADRSTKVQVKVHVGTINLATNDQGPGSSNVVQTDVASAKIGGNTEASVGAGDDGKQSNISVTRGDALIKTQAGETFRAKTNERLEFEQTGKLVKRSSVTGIAVLRSPENQQTVRAVPPRPIKFDWNPVANVKKYLIEVATSTSFDTNGSIVRSRDGLTTNSATFDKLPPGVYYWRVRADSATEEGSFSDPYKFVIAAGGNTKVLNISVVRKTPMGGGTYLIEGKCDVGARVRVGERWATVEPGGNFRAIVSLEHGSREVVLQAEDLDGNTGRQTVKF